MNNRLRTLRAATILTFITLIIGLLIHSRIMAYSLAPTMTPASFKGLPWWQVPIAYVIDYLSHGWICLTFAFVAAGLVNEFMPKKLITKQLSSKSVLGYIVASGVAPFFTVCSCTMVPLFAGILYSGSGIGPAIAFLLMAPAANMLTIILTGELLGWDLALVRIIVSLVTAIAAGLIVSNTPWGRKIEEENRVTVATSAAINVIDPPLDERLWSALKFGWFLGKKILPAFFLGLVSVSYLQAYVPEEAVATYLTGVGGVLLASVIGGPLYTPTLVEIALARGLISLGMSPAATLSWLMGQPYDIPNMIATSGIVRWRVVITYAVVALAFSIIGGVTYGLVTGKL